MSPAVAAAATSVATAFASASSVGVREFDVESMVHEIRKRHLDNATTLGESWSLGLLQGYPYLKRE